uniref:Uncharacterized protein n=1 Tax=Picea sitchensis TaxID=3332 RepID=A9P2F0_PICSI|nr:unknown [Picea sitchensis]
MASEIQLITIGPSHFCEKARWGLDRAGISYKESKHAPVFHMLYTRGLGQGTSCPKLVLGEGKNKVVLHESSDILKFADENIMSEEDRLYPSNLEQSVQEWDTKFNEILGPHARRFAYFYLLYDKHSFKIFSQGLHSRERLLTWCLMPLLKPLVYRTVGCNSPAAKDHSLDKIRCIFQEVDNVLADGRPFLCGNEFTAADLTFASLAGPVLCPVGYGTYLVPTEELPSEMSEVTLSLRETLAGKHALRMYETERHRKVASKVLVT